MQSDNTWTRGRGAEGVSDPLERDTVNLRHRSAEHALWRQSDTRLSSGQDWGGWSLRHYRTCRQLSRGTSVLAPFHRPCQSGLRQHQRFHQFGEVCWPDEIENMSRQNVCSGLLQSEEERQTTALPDHSGVQGLHGWCRPGRTGLPEWWRWNTQQRHWSTSPAPRRLLQVFSRLSFCYAARWLIKRYS